MSNVQSLSQRYEQVKRETEQAQETLSHKETTAAATKKEKATLETQLAAKKRDLEAKLRAIGKLEAEIVQAETKIKSHEDAKKKLEDQSARIGRPMDIARFENIINAKEADIKVHEAAITKDKTEIKRATDDIEKIEHAKTDIDKKALEIDTSSAKMNDQRTVANKREQIHKENTLRQSIEAEIREIEQKISNIDRNDGVTETAIRVLKTTLDAKKRDLTRAEGEYKEALRNSAIKTRL